MSSESKSGIFKSDIGLVSVSLYQGCISWKTEPESENINVAVHIEDIIGVVGGDKSWTLHYVSSKTAGKWTPSEITFTADDQETSAKWINILKDAIYKIKLDRPRKLLVFVNPVSGQGTAEKNFNAIAKPLLEIAEVSTEIIVSEDASHPDRVIQDYDLTTIDGIIAVGGDGTFRLVTSALIKRCMKDAGRDFNDSTQDIVNLPVKLGILPGGTGQALAKIFTGTPMKIQTPEYEISILQIILGHTHSGKIISIHNNDKLVDYVSIMVTYGVMCEWFSKAEERRRFGALRYLFGWIGQLVYFRQPHNITMTIPVLGENKQTVIVKTGKLKMADAFGLHTYDGDTYYDVDTMSVIWMEENSSRRDLWKCFRMMIQYEDYAAGDVDTVKRIFAPEYTLELPAIPEGSTETHHIAADGDYTAVEPGILKVKLHTKVLTLFGTGLVKDKTSTSSSQ